MLRIAKGLTVPELVEAVRDNTEARKQIKDTSHLESGLKVIFKTIEQVNALSELEKNCGGTRLEDLMLPSWSAPFILPSKVALNSEFWAKDLVERPVKDSAFIYNEAEVTKAAYDVGNVVKAKPNMVSASELRSSVKMLSEVSYCIGNNTRQSDHEIFVPVPLTDKLSALLGDWSNTTVDKMLELYFSRTDIVK